MLSYSLLFEVQVSWDTLENKLFCLSVLRRLALEWRTNRTEVAACVHLR